MSIPYSSYIVPDDPNVPYDMHAILSKLIDEHSFFEIMPDHARNIICGLGRLDGYTVAIVGNNPKHLAGCLDVD
eukprot:gene346-426_t